MCRLSEKADKHHPGLLMLFVRTRSTSQGWEISLLRAQTYTQVPVGGSSHACLHIKHIMHTHMRSTHLSDKQLPLHRHVALLFQAFFDVCNNFLLSLAKDLVVR